MCAAHVFTFRVDSDRQVVPVVARAGSGRDLVESNPARVLRQSRRNVDNVVERGIYDLSTGQVNGFKDNLGAGYAMQTHQPGALTAGWMDQSQHTDRSNRGNFPSPIQPVISRSDALTSDLPVGRRVPLPGLLGSGENLTNSPGGEESTRRSQRCRPRRLAFTDPHLCAAMMDRLTFNGTVIETGTDSYRLAHTLAQQAAS